MDPRLNPQMNPATPQPVRPQLPPVQPQMAPSPPPQPAPQPAPAAMPSQTQTHLKAEIVEAIPVRQPGQAEAVPAAPAPVIQMPSSPAQSEESHDDLDRILKAVNSRVAAPPPEAGKPKKQIVKKIAAKAAQVKPGNKSPKPLVVTVAVIIIALVLCALAVYAYRQGGSASPLSNQPAKVGTSYTASDAIQSAGGTLVRPSDLDDYSQELQTKLNSLNDSQDFAPQPLTDQVLGL
jgi:hypothetical protein